MKRRHENQAWALRRQLRGALAPTLCLVLAFHTTLSSQPLSIQVHAAEQQQQQQQQHAPSEPHISVGAANLMSAEAAASALESSAALAGDDLLAAESTQSLADASSAAEHKSFTNAQVVRQDNAQQMAASVAPVQFNAAGPQQQQQMQHAPPPQQPPMFNLHHAPQQQQQAPHMPIQSRLAPHQQKAFNPFMAAALAGNYGPAQQQIAAAAAASIQHAAHQQPAQSHAHPHQAHYALHQAAVQQHPQMVQQQQHAVQHQQMHNMMPHPQQHQQQQQQISHNQQLVRQQVAAAVVPAPEQAALAVQESTVRSNVLPAPNYNANLDSNSIELGAEHSQQQQQVQRQAPDNQAASSAQHPVIAGPGTQMQESASNAWPLQAPDIPKIVNLEVKCEKNLMKVSIEFDKVFNGVIFSKGHYNQGQCLHVNQNSGKQQAYFDISINSCGTQGNTQNGLYGMGGNTGSGTYFENTIVVQYDPNVQEVYDHARKLRCTWHDQYEKAVTFRPFPVDMLDIVRADFAGDNVGCWMQIQVGKGPWASEVAGIVKIGQTMTMVLAIKDEENKFDMLVRNCFAHDGKRGPIELVDKSGCITRPKLMSRFTKIKNFGSSATVLSYAHFQAFKFPDSMEVHFQCTIQICRHQCPDQCSSGPNGALALPGAGEAYSESTISGTFNINGANAQPADSGAGPAHLRKFGTSSGAPLSREKRSAAVGMQQHWNASSAQQFRLKPMTQAVGLNRVIQVVSTGDLAFAFQQQQQQQTNLINGTFDSNGDLDDQTNQPSAARLVDLSQQICMSSYNFVLSLVVLVLVLLCSSLLAVSLYLRQRNYAKRSNKLLVPSHLDEQLSRNRPIQFHANHRV